MYIKSISIFITDTAAHITKCTPRLYQARNKEQAATGSSSSSSPASPKRNKGGKPTALTKAGKPTQAGGSDMYNVFQCVVYCTGCPEV